MYYKLYAANIFVLFRSPDHLEKCNENLNTKHANLKLANEKDVKRSLSFLDVVISQNDNGFTAIIYHKPMLSRFYSSFNRFIANEYEHCVILFVLLFRIFSIVPDFSSFDEEINYCIKETFFSYYFR